MAGRPRGNTPPVELVPDSPDDPRARTATRTATRTTGGRQRVLAAMVVAAAGLLVYSLSGGPWARAEIGGGGPSGDAAVTQLELRLSGDVDVEPGDGPVADDLDGPGAARSALAASIGGATRDLTQVLGVLIVVVSAVGVALELRSRLWGLLASASLVCLLAATVLRDMATSALATGATAADAGPFAVDPTGWSGLAIGAAAVAALASFLATAERGVAGPDPTPVFGPDETDEPDEPDVLDPTATARRRRAPAGRVRRRLLNSLPSRER